MATFTAEQESKLEELTSEDLDQLLKVMDDHIAKSDEALEAFEKKNEQILIEGNSELDSIGMQAEEVENRARRTLEETSREQVLASLR